MSTTVIYPAGGVGGASVDGQLTRQFRNESWAAIRGGAGDGHNDTGAYAYVKIGTSTSVGTNWGQIYRFIATFASSALAGQIATEVIASLYIVSKTNEVGGGGLRWGSSSPASHNDLADADYSEVGEVDFGGSDYASISASAYLNTTLNTSGLAHVNSQLGSVIKLCVREAQDMSGVEPSINQTSLQNMYSVEPADEAGTTKDPKITITHEDAPVTANSLFFGGEF